MKILVADDDTMACALLEAALKNLGHEVVLAHNGWQALDALAREPIQTIISDWQMPQMNGLELCSHLRKKGGPDYTYFILLTQATADSENHEKACAAGVDDFLVKPPNPQELKLRLHVASRILDHMHTMQHLESMIPICSYCKNIREDDGYWQRIENYISDRTGSQFSHSICPTCYDRYVKEELEETCPEPCTHMQPQGHSSSHSQPAEQSVTQFQPHSHSHSAPPSHPSASLDSLVHSR